MLGAIARFLTTPRRYEQLGPFCGFATVRITERQWLQALWQAAEQREAFIDEWRCDGASQDDIDWEFSHRPPVILDVNRRGFHRLLTKTS
jgi:hypothetical protein